jgi:hypothetical protein
VKNGGLGVVEMLSSERDFMIPLLIGAGFQVCILYIIPICIAFS